MRYELLAAFILGCVLTYCFIECFEKPLPPAIEVVRSGKMIGYADTSPNFTEFVMVKNAKSPGLFLAFPIYQNRQDMYDDFRRE